MNSFGKRLVVVAVAFGLCCVSAAASGSRTAAEAKTTAAAARQCISPEANAGAQHVPGGPAKIDGRRRQVDQRHLPPRRLRRI